MKSKKLSHYPTGIGFVSIMVFFSVMCFVMIGVLSLASALSDKKMTTEMINNNHNYYLAYSEIQKEIEKIDTELESLYINNDYNKEKILNHIHNAHTDGDNIFISLNKAIDENRQIFVKLKVNTELYENKGFYNIVIFKTCVNTDIEINENIPVYKGVN